MTMIVIPVPAEKPLLVRYAYDKLKWFTDYCKRWDIVATYHYRNEYIRVQLASMAVDNQWVVRDISLNYEQMDVIALKDGIWRSYRFHTMMFESKFAQCYKNISENVIKCMSTINEIRRLLVRDVCRTWVLCARRLRVCKDIRRLVCEMLPRIITTCM